MFDCFMEPNKSQYSQISLTFKVIVEPIHEEGPRAEVYEPDLPGPGLDEDVLVLDVAVEDPAVVAQ